MIRTLAPRTKRRPRAALWLALALVLALAACAKSGDVDRLAEENRVQDQRLKDLEDSVGQTLARQQNTLDELERTVRALRGQVANATDRTERLASEVTALSETLERDTAERRKLARTTEEQVAQLERFRTELQSDLDKLQLRVVDLEQLLQSPIASLPSRTAADKAFREAFYAMVSGELDVAADRFAAFRKEYKDDPRAVEALYRQGQAYFLMRRYDHALLPFFELVDKHPQHKLAVEARWYLARSLEETGDLKLAREFYTQLVSQDTPYAKEATRRLAFINKLYPQQ